MGLDGFLDQCATCGHIRDDHSTTSGCSGVILDYRYDGRPKRIRCSCITWQQPDE